MNIDEKIREQRAWMRSCGGTRSGYRERYGVKGKPGCYGDGGDAIYEADLAELNRLEGQRAAS